MKSYSLLYRRLRKRLHISQPWRPTPRRRGVVAVQVGVLLVALVGFAALTVDVGAMYNARAELQRSADAAALAAAGMLGEYGAGDPVELAVAAAVEHAAANPVLGQAVVLDPNVDIEFGRANYNEAGNSYTFTPGGAVPDAVRITARRTSNSPNGPLELFFAGVLGKNSAEITAEAIAVMVPRDIAIVADLSGSMNDDSELRNVHDTQINLFDVWAGLPLGTGLAGILNGSDPAAPGAAMAGDLHPASGPGLPGHVGGNPNEFNEAFADSEAHGPRWGWMTTWGTELTPGVYDPVDDTGLYYIPRYNTCTDPEVIQNLIEAGYSSSERSALLSSSYDSSSTYYRNRVKALLGVCGWDSGKSGGKYSAGVGNGNGIVGSSELVQTVDYPFNSGSWSSYIDYVKGSSQMRNGDSAFRYRYGIKTFTNYLLEKKPKHSQTAELAATPTQPVQAVKYAVQHMVEVIESLETDDQVSLEIYGESVHHEYDLTDAYFDVTDRLNEMQAGHYDVWTNMGGGIEQATQELTQSGRQRAASRKIMILLTDGRANVDEYGHTGDYSGGKEYALDAAQEAANAGVRIFAVSHGFGADTDIMEQIAEIGNGRHFHAEGSIDEYSEQLDEIFNTLGGKRPVELIK